MALILKKKKLLLNYFSHFLGYSPQGKYTKILQHISHLHTYTCLVHPIDCFRFTKFAKITNLSCMVSLGATPVVDSYSRHYGAINK